MPAFCLGNRSPDYFPWVFGGEQPWAAGGDQCGFPSPRPPAPALRPSRGGNGVTAPGDAFPLALLARGWIRPRAEPCEAFLRLLQLFRRFPLSPRQQLPP